MRQPARPVLAFCFVFVLAAGPATAAAQEANPAVAASTAASPASSPVAEPSSAASEIDASPSFRDLFGDAVLDFANLPTWSNVAILTAGGIGAMTAHAADADVTRTLAAADDLGGFLHPGETIGGARTQLAAALATYAAGRITSNAKVTAIGADLIKSQIVTQTLTAAIKMSVGRGRPDGTQYSFPSGHSSVSFATATVLQRHLGWKVGVPAYGLAAYVAASRVQVKRHFLSDVTFGAAIGIVSARAVTVGRGNARFAVAPAPTAGGAGVSFTWLGKN
jgi:membrane-associated phospholipid phosphatase